MTYRFSSPRKAANTVALGLLASLALCGGVALGQPHPSPERAKDVSEPDGFARPARRPGSPGSWSPPRRIGPDGLPLARPDSSGRPRGVPGSDPRRPGADPHRRGPRHPRPPAGGAHHEEEHAGHDVECPGHGAEDPPPAMNLWHGLFMVNNARAQKPGFINKLLFRYENPKDHCDRKNEPPPFLASVINFGVLAFVLYRYGKKPLAEALVKRKLAIMADIDTASRLKEDAAARLAEYQEKLDNIADTLVELRAEYAAQAEAEKQHVLADAEERRVRMRRDAEFRIEQELKTARVELMNEAVDAAVRAAEELVKKQVSARDLDRMANDYIASIGSSLAQSSAVQPGAPS